MLRSGSELSIRNLFKPYQPSIAFSGEESVIYEECTSLDGLNDYIFCYWRLHTPKPLKEPFKYRVVSDGCIDVLLEQSDPETIFITGFSNQFLEYELGCAFDYLGVRFLPTGFPTLFDHSAHSLTNEFLLLADVLPDFHESMSNSIEKSMNLNEAAKRFNDFFSHHLKSLTSTPKVDRRLLNAMLGILRSGGRVHLSQLDVGVSERQLRRLFEFYFGDSPKTFARIIRFQKILGAKPSIDSLKHNKIFYDEGFYDQAHFIKEFKAFYGVTPNKAFGR